MGSAFRIHQTLHGYEDGHQLLASSYELSRDQETLLLIMSDLSGSAFRTGYESYLTGYSLNGSGFYCIAKTWIAPEMPRPGCVWTQTFLIRDEDLARVESFFAVIQLFNRPDRELGFDNYTTVLNFQNPPLSSEILTADVKELLFGLYGTDRNVLIPSNSSAPFEPIVLAVIQQAWPRLRRGLRFCTGALSPRESEFDLSVSPPELTHSAGSAGIIVDGRESGGRAFEAWVIEASDDLHSLTAQTAYRKFLWHFGADHADGRSAFKPLTEIFLLLHSMDIPLLAEKVLSAVAHYFPSVKEGRRLKVELFGGGGRFSVGLGGEAAVLRLLVGHPAASVIDPEIAQISSRAAELAKADLDVATEVAIFGSNIGGQNAELFLEGYIREGRWNEEAFAKMPAQLVPLVLERQPELIASPTLWSRHGQMGLVSKFVTQIGRSPQTLLAVISGMINAKAWDALDILVDRLGDDALFGIFQVIDASNSKSLAYPDGLLALFSSNANSVRHILLRGALGQRSLAILSTELDPRSWFVRDVPTQVWANSAAVDFKYTSKARSLRSAVFYLSVGLGSRDPSGAILVSRSFENVYLAAADDAIEAALWDRLEPNLAWYSPSGDKCARLVRSAVRAFKDKAWELDLFAQTFMSRELFSRALFELNESYSGHRYIVRMNDAAKSKVGRLSSEQRAMLSKAASAR